MSRAVTPFYNREVRRLAARYGLDLREFGRVQNNTGAVDLPTIPDTAEGLEDLLSDSAKMAKVFSNKGTMKTFIQNYADAFVNKDKDFTPQIRNECEKFLVEWLKTNQSSEIKRLNQAIGTDHIIGGAGKGAKYNKKAPGAVLDGEFEDMADFAKSIWHNNHNPDNANKLARIRNSFTEMVPSDGGFLVPEAMRSELLRVALTQAVIRSRARVIPMETLRVSFPAIDATSNASSVYGGIIGYWTEEAGTLTQSQARFSKIALEAWKLTALARVSNELLADSMTSFSALIEEIFPEALAWFEDIAFISGSGVGEPLGILNATAAVTVSKESAQAADTVVWENIIKMFARLLPTSMGRAVWLVDPGAFVELATMALTVGAGGSAVWLNNGVEGPPMTLLGRPVIFTEKVSALGDLGDINLVDLGYYLIGDRQQMSAMSSQHSRFSTDETEYRFIQRVDGKPWIQSAITPKNGGSTLSPFVKLEAR